MNGHAWSRKIKVPLGFKNDYDEKGMSYIEG